jgi:competence protein ComEC
LLLIIIGIAAGSKWNPDLVLILTGFGLLFISWLFIEVILRKHYPLNSSHAALSLYFLIIISAAAVWTSVLHEHQKSTAEIARLLNLFAWDEVVMSGEIRESGYSSSGRPVYLMEVIKTEIGDTTQWHMNYGARLYGDGSLEMGMGESVVVSVGVYHFPERRNPHEFDYGDWLIRQGISAHGEIVHIVNRESVDRWGWNKMRNRVRNNIEAIFSEQSEPIAKALLLGYKQDIAAETRKQFARSGLAHIMAVSGLHVGFIVVPFWIAIPFLWGNKWGRIAGLMFLTILLAGYAGITGFSPSVNRASLMAWLITYAKLFNKTRNTINLTAAAAIVLLIIDPEQLFNVGFQLSFSAVFIILLVMPEAQRLIPKRYRYGKAGFMSGIILVSVVVQAGLYPILITYFGEFSIAGPIANAAVIPLLAITVPTGLVLSVIPAEVSSMLPFLSWPVEFSLRWVEAVAETIGSRELSYVESSLSSPLLFFMWIVSILFIASVRVPELRTKLFILFLLVLNVTLFESLQMNRGTKPLKVTVLDVGQGDAIHIKTPGGKNVLIDTGWWSPAGNSGNRTIIPYMNFMNIEKIDAIILTHPHADHIGGVESIIGELKVDKIYQSSFPYNSQVYHRYQKLAYEKGIPIVNTYSGMLIDLDEKIRIYVLGPREGMLYPPNPNNYSVAVKVVYGEVSFLFTGDAEREQEHQLAVQYGDFLKSTVYKMGHHGSRTSSTEILMNYVQPTYTVASLAFKNRFNHPGHEAVWNVSKYADKAHFTSLQGAVIFIADGESVGTKEWRPQ